MKATADLWKSISGFQGITSKPFLISKIEYQFQTSLEEDLKRRRHAIKLLACDIEHPYSRLGIGSEKTLTTPQNIDQQGGSFFKKAYAKEGSVLVVVKSSKPTKSTDSDTYVHGSLESDLQNILDYNPGNIADKQSLNDGGMPNKI